MQALHQEEFIEGPMGLLSPNLASDGFGSHCVTRPMQLQRLLRVEGCYSGQRDASTARYLRPSRLRGAPPVAACHLK